MCLGEGGRLAFFCREYVSISSRARYTLHLKAPFNLHLGYDNISLHSGRQSSTTRGPRTLVRSRRCATCWSPRWPTIKWRVWEVSNGGLGPALAAITAEEANHQRAPVQPTPNAAEPALLAALAANTAAGEALMSALTGSTEHDKAGALLCHATP